MRITPINNHSNRINYNSKAKNNVAFTSAYDTFSRIWTKQASHALGLSPKSLSSEEIGVLEELFIPRLRLMSNRLLGHPRGTIEEIQATFPKPMAIMPTTIFDSTDTLNPITDALMTVGNGSATFHIHNPNNPSLNFAFGMESTGEIKPVIPIDLDRNYLN